MTILEISNYSHIDPVDCICGVLISTNEFGHRYVVECFASPSVDALLRFVAACGFIYDAAILR